MSGSLRTRPYDAGNAGAICLAEAEIDFSAASARQLICTVPAGAVILKAWVDLVTAFNAGTSNLVTVGYGAIGAGTADDIVAAVTEGTPGIYPGVGDPNPFPASLFAADTDVYAYYTPGAADATTGKAKAFVMYARLATNGQ